MAAGGCHDRSMNPVVTWMEPPAAPVLDPAAVHVWRARTDRRAGVGEHLLDAAERARLAGITAPTQRQRFVAARCFVRQTLARYLGEAPEALRFDALPGGKPILAGADRGLCFNLSHTGNLALLAVAGFAVGVDVEALRPVPRCLAIARRVLPAADVAELEGLSGAMRERRFLELWTRFEARQKALGAGVFGQSADEATVSSRMSVPEDGHVGALAWMGAAEVPAIAYFGDA